MTGSLPEFSAVLYGNSAYAGMLGPLCRIAPGQLGLYNGILNRPPCGQLAKRTVFPSRGGLSAWSVGHGAHST